MQFVRVDALKTGDQVEAEGDLYIDDGSEKCEALRFALLTVAGIDMEEPNVASVVFESFGIVDMPIDHKVRVV